MTPLLPPPRRRLLRFLSPLLALFALVPLRAEPGHVFKPLSSEEIARIDAAVPDSAPARPSRPRRLLVFHRTEGWVHASIPHGNEALRRLGEKTGAYEAVLSDDMAAFESENLARFDAVVFHNTTRLKFDNPAHRAALLAFVRSGKGLAGIHSGIDNFPTWPEAQAMIGGVFHSHPWNAGDTVAIKLDDPAHPLNAVFAGQGFWLREEIYQIVGPYSRDRQRVLMSLDMSQAANARDPAKFKIVRTDGDFPVGWIKPEGAGRAFFSSLGHNRETFESPAVLRHFLAGLQYALGDLAADATPSARLDPAPMPAPAPPKHDKISVLIIDGQNNHDWPRATALLREMLVASGRFTVEVSTTPDRAAPPEAWTAWRPDFSRHRVVISNYNSGHQPDAPRWPAEVKAAFESYVRGGGGFVAYHAANNAFLAWPAYNEMIGLGWRDKAFGPSLVVAPDRSVVTIPASQGRDPGHGPEHDFVVTVLNAEHPITRGLPASWIHPHEQLTHGQHGPAKNLTVLHYAYSKDTRENEPMDWTVAYGKGRVYTTMLGHLWADGPDTALRCAGFQTLFLRGVEWAATGQVTQPVPADFPSPAKASLR